MSVSAPIRTSILLRVVSGSIESVECHMQPWVDVLSKISVITDLQIPLAGTQFRGCGPYTNDQEILDNAMVTLRHFDQRVQDVLQFEYVSGARSSIHYLSPEGTQVSKEDIIGAFINVLPKVLIIQARNRSQFEYREELSTGGKYMNLVGTVEGNTEKQWAHFLGDDGSWHTTGTEEGDIRSLTRNTKFLIYKQGGDNRCASQPWFELFSRLESVRDSATALVKPREAPSCEKYGLPQRDIVFLVSNFQEANPEIFKDKWDLTCLLNQVDSTDKILLHIGSPEKMPEILILSTRNPEAIYFPRSFNGYGKCMRFIGAINQDEKTIRHSQEVTQESMFLVYEHQADCDDDGARALEEMQERLAIGIQKAKDAVREAVMAVSGGLLRLEHAGQRQLEAMTPAMAMVIPRKLTAKLVAIQQIYWDTVLDLDEQHRYFMQELHLHPTRQAATIAEILRTLESYSSGLFSVINAQLVATISKRDRDPNAPMTFSNPDGSCFANSPAQVLFILPGIKTFVACMHFGTLRDALLELIHRREAGRAISFATKLRHALGEEQSMCSGSNGVATMKQLIEHIPSLFSVSEFFDFKAWISDSSAIRDQVFTKSPSFAFVERQEGLPETRALTDVVWSDGKGQEVVYELVASLERQFSGRHIFANVRIPVSDSYQWYSLSDFTARKRHFTDLKADAMAEGGTARLLTMKTAMLVYQRKPTEISQNPIHAVDPISEPEPPARIQPESRCGRLARFVFGISRSLGRQRRIP